MNEKEKIEMHVAQMFFQKTEGEDVSPDGFRLGDHLKKEPDVLYKDMGIEIGAVLRGLNTGIEDFEKKFLAEASEKITGKIPDIFQIRLVMQDDNRTVLHTPRPEFEKYQYLPKYLDGFFVYQFDGCDVANKVVLNQITERRENVFPTGKDVGRFLGELVAFVNSLGESDFRNDITGKSHHSVVTDGKVVKAPVDPIEDFVPPKIIDKLSKDKYCGSYTKQILLLHSFSFEGIMKFTSNVHFYSHHRDDIFNFLWSKINENDSFQLYDGIYFLDFSLSCGDPNRFELIDFSDYSLRAESKYLHGWGQVCMRPIPVFCKNKKQK